MPQSTLWILNFSNEITETRYNSFTTHVRLFIHSVNFTLNFAKFNSTTPCTDRYSTRNTFASSQMFRDFMIQPNEILASALRIYSWARYTLIFDEFDAIFSTVNSSRNGLAIRNANSELILNCYEFNINILFEDLYNNRNVFTCLIKRYVYTYTLHTIQYTTHICAGFFFIKTEHNRSTIFVPYKWCVIDGIKVNLICTQTEMWIVWKWVRANKKISNDNCALCICAANIYMISTLFLSLGSILMATSVLFWREKNYRFMWLNDSMENETATTMQKLSHHNILCEMVYVINATSAKRNSY